MVNTSTDYKNNKESLIKDIAEREKIISDYKKYGVLDRDKAINKIQELRIKDKEELDNVMKSIRKIHNVIDVKEEM